MPRSKSVLKRQRQTEVRRLRNKSVRSALKSHEKRVRAAAGTSESQSAYVVLQRNLDKAASKGVIHPNKAARKKSRLAKVIAASS